MPRRVRKLAPQGLEPPAGVRKRRKATVKKRRNTAPEFKALDPNFVFKAFLRVKAISTLKFHKENIEKA